MAPSSHTFTNTSEAYLTILKLVFEQPDYVVSPRKFPIKEKFNVGFTVLSPSSASIITRDQERNAVIKDYVTKEFGLYDQKTNKMEEFAKASKFWSKLGNPDGTINSAYGHLIWFKKSCGNPYLEALTETSTVEMRPEEKDLMRTPWEWAKNSLLQDKDTRQAILRVSLPEHQYNGCKDQVCTMHGLFSIREDQLHLGMVMRSCDLVKGLAYDLPWFCFLLEKMFQEVQGSYSGLQIGTYTHFVHSLHIYDRDAEVVKKMIGYD